MIDFVKSLLGCGTDADPMGPDAIASALYELSDDVQPAVGHLGEPWMANRGGDFSTHYRVIIPVEIDTGEDVADLEFDLPNGLDDEDAEFYDFLAEYGIEEVESLSALSGTEISIEWTGGTPVPTWQ